MKRDKFKKMRFQLETLKPAKAEDCALLLKGLTMETSETSNFSMESVEQKKRGVPFAVKRLEFSFGNGKKVDMTDRVSVLSRDCLAGLGKGNFYGEGCKTAGKEKCSYDRGSPVSGEDWGRGLLSLWRQRVVDGPGEKDS